MPNWCENSIEITGPRDLIAGIWDATITTENQDGLLEAICPQPEYGEEQEGTMPNWWNWRVSNWGTKWDIDSEGLEFFDNGDGTASITGHAQSAWSPPIEALAHFASSHEGVYAQIHYFEPGMAFVGHWDSDGSDDHYSYAEYDSKSIREHVPEYLVEYWDLESMLADWEEMEE